jgi:hypothetical protein
VGEVSAVKAGEVWYSMQGDAHYVVLTDGDLGCYAREVQQRSGVSEWEPVPREPKVWLTTKQLTQLGELVGTMDLPATPGA